MKLSVCVVTYNRPAFLARCLRSVVALQQPPDQIVIVDASPAYRRPEELRSSDVYMHAPELAGWMTKSRNRGLEQVSGDIIAFLDDDVVVHNNWSECLVRAFRETDAAAIVGRTINHQFGEEHYDKGVGRLLPDGTLTDGFASLSAGRVYVDHGIGANMSFRRSTLATLGGFRDDYPGTALREDTDVFLRLKQLSMPAYFDPTVAVDHLPAPHVTGRRFDTRYKLYARRNHMVLLARHAGIGSSILGRWVGRQIAAVKDAPGITRKLERAGVTFLGLGFGAIALPRHARLGPTVPQRNDATGKRISQLLSSAQPIIPD